MAFPWLSTLLFTPILSAAVLLATHRVVSVRTARWASLGASLMTLGLAIAIATQFDSKRAERFQLTEQHEWIKAFGAHYALGVDGLGIVMLLMTAILTPVVILASWNEELEGSGGTRGYLAWILGLEGIAFGVFEATDVFLFFCLFEASLLPIFFLTSGFGHGNKNRAAVKFLLFSITGGLIMLAAVVGLHVAAEHAAPGSASYLLTDLSALHLGPTSERWLFAGFMFAFAVKAPMVPLHTWLPDIAETATPGTAVLLVSVLDKIGTFGMVRYGLQLFPDASRWASPAISVMAVAGIIYGALLAIGATNLPRLIAYTSISHFGFIVVGLFALNAQGVTGSMFYMFNHGLSTACLFLVAGFLVARRRSDELGDFGGVEHAAPVLSGLFLFAGLSTLALPGMSSFVSEFLVIVGTFSHSHALGAVAVLGIVLSAIYVLRAYQRVMTGPADDEVRSLPDIKPHERAAIVPLVALIVVLGFYPRPILGLLNPLTNTIAPGSDHSSGAQP